jgi:hypothetical protein
MRVQQTMVPGGSGGDPSIRVECPELLLEILQEAFL